MSHKTDVERISDMSDSDISAKLESMRLCGTFRKKRKRNAQTVKNYSRAYYLRNKERFAISTAKRHNQKLGLVSDLSKVDWDDALSHFNHLCAYCGDEGKLQKEHVIPVSRGGSFSRTNIVPACSPCNQSKSAKLLHDWYRYSVVYSEKRLLQLIGWIYGTDGLNEVRERFAV